MKVVFKKRRFYKDRFYEAGEIVQMDAKHFRAFSRVGVVVPTSTITSPAVSVDDLPPLPPPQKMQRRKRANPAGQKVTEVKASDETEDDPLVEFVPENTPPKEEE